MCCVLHSALFILTGMSEEIQNRRFVSAAEAATGRSPWALEEWLCRNDVVANEELLLVRVNMEVGKAHAFHTHPHREEIIYVISGTAEQWVGKEKKILKAGDTAFIPKGEVHGTYNVGDDTLVFLAILSPSNAPEPSLVDVSQEEPWASLRETSSAVV